MSGCWKTQLRERLQAVHLEALVAEEWRDADRMVGVQFVLPWSGNRDGAMGRTNAACLARRSIA